MNKIFAFPLAIKGTREQFNVLRPRLEALGYKIDPCGRLDDELLVTNYGKNNNLIGFSYKTDKRTVVDASNEELVLALAAACTNDTLQKDEHFLYNDGKWSTASHSAASSFGSNYRRPTKEEIIEHFSSRDDAFVLPENWCVVITNRNIKILNSFRQSLPNYKDHWVMLEVDNAMAFDGKMILGGVCQGFTEITFEQFKKYVMKEKEFILPKDWYVIWKSPEDTKVTNDWAKSLGKKGEKISGLSFVSDAGILSDYTYKSSLNPIRYGYKKISMDQFRQYVLKENISNRTIIGYKLIKPEYEKVAIKALNLANKTAYDPFIIAGMISHYIPKIKDLGIMDWFEPVYEAEEVKLVLGTSKIEISIKDGKIFADNHDFPVSALKNLLKNTDTGSFCSIHNYQIEFPAIKIGCSTFTREELQQIVDTAEKQLKQ